MTRSNRGYAVQSVGDAWGFYRVSLLTGKTDFIGTFKRPVVDIAVPLNQ